MPSDYLLNRNMVKLGMAPQSVSWADGPLTFNEVAKFFAVPIADAAQKLGVCVSTLKRICKENGIPRWPYRKFLAGKSIEDIKQDALRDMANNQLVNQRLEQQQQLKPPPSAHNRDSVSGTPHLGAKLLVAGGHADPKLFMMQPTVAVNQLLPHQSSMQPHRTFPVQSHVPVLRITPPQQPTATQGNNSSSASTPSTYVRSPLSAGTLPAQTLQKQKAPIPSFLDELKLGYPSKGLSRASSRWWGPAITGNGKDTAIAGALGSEVDQDDTDTVSEVKACTTASALFVRTRKKAAIRGRRVLSHAALRGYGVQRLDAKDAALLRFVFANQLPKQWTAAFPPIT